MDSTHKGLALCLDPMTLHPIRLPALSHYLLDHPGFFSFPGVKRKIHEGWNPMFLFCFKECVYDHFANLFVVEKLCLFFWGKPSIRGTVTLKTDERQGNNLTFRFLIFLGDNIEVLRAVDIYSS